MGQRHEKRSHLPHYFGPPPPPPPTSFRLILFHPIKGATPAPRRMRPVVAKAGAGAPIRSKWGWVAVLALMLAGLLAPGEARAVNECGGSITSTNPSRTCTAAHGGGTGTFASGIIYRDAHVNPGAGIVARLDVPGAAAAWTVTSGSGAGTLGTGITLASQTGSTAGAGLALTVGGAGSANNVNIRQRSPGAPAGGDSNSGIVVNNRFTGASTTTVTINAGVTIGTSSARMLGSGIRAGVVRGSGAASLTSAAEIHSTGVGIVLQRGASADTTAATTITNTGAISAGTRGILLNYDAGDATNDGDAKITNRGAITIHTGTETLGAIHLLYDSGHGAAEVENHGAITATGSDVTLGYGIQLDYNAAAGSGAATIRNTAAIASKHTAIVLNNAGSGAAAITNSGDLTTTLGTSNGITLQHTGSAGGATVTNSGDIRPGDAGISVKTTGKIATGTTASASVIHSDGAITASNTGSGILVEVGDPGETIANAGDAVITVTGGSVESGDIALTARNRQAGNAVIAVSEGVTLTSRTKHGIYGHLPVENVAGGVTITNAAAITGAQAGIYAWRQAAAGAGNISITNHGAIKKTGVVNFAGIWVQDSGTGNVTVRNSGNIGEAGAPMHQRGIQVQKMGSSGDVSVTTTGGSIIAQREGISVTDTAGHTGDVTISNGGDVTAERPIRATRLGKGPVTFTNTGGTVRSESATAIFVANGLGDASDVTVNVEGGTVRSPRNAFQASNFGAGDVIVNVAAGATVISGSTGAAPLFGSIAAVYAELFRDLASDNRVKITQGGKIEGRTGVYARAGGSGVFEDTPGYEVAKRAEGKPDVIDVTWTGAFSHGTADTDVGRYGAPNASNLVNSALLIEAERATGGLYGSAAGVEAQVMSRSEVRGAVAASDDPGAIADKAAQDALLAADGDASRRTAILAQFKAALGNEEIDAAAVRTAIETDGTEGLSDDEIVTYLSTDDATTRRVLRNVLALGLSDGEKSVMEAVATGDDVDAALRAAGFTDDPDDDEDYWSRVKALLNRYNPGNVNVAMNGGSIDSRGDGIRAYYATPHANNGAIAVTVAEGARITAAKTGIYVANAGSGVRVENQGMIKGGEFGIRVLAPSTMTNAGMSRSSHQVGSGSVVVRNWGTVEGNKVAIEVPAGSTVDNYGTITSTDGILVAFRGIGTSTLTMGENAMADGIIEGRVEELNVREACREHVMLFVNGEDRFGERRCEPMATPKPSPSDTPSGPSGRPVWPLGTSVFALTDDMLSDLTGSIHGAVVDMETGLRSGPAAAGQVVWATPFGGARDQNGSGDVADATHYFGGGLVGTSWGAQDVRVGGFIGGSVGRLDVGNSPGGNQTMDVDVQTVFGGLVASRAMGNVLYDARLLIGHMTHDSTRRLSLVETAEVEYASLFFSPEVGVATTLHVTDTLDVLPRLRVRYAGLFTQSFRERGQRTNTRWDMSFDDRTVQVLEWRAEVGVPVAWANGGQLKPRVGLEGRWLLSGHEIKVTDINGNPFSYDAGGDDGVITGTVGLGMAVPVVDSMALVGSFDGALTTEEAWRATGYLGLTYSF